MRLSRALLFLWSFCLVGFAAAKEVSLSRDPISFARSYELEIYRDKTIHVSQKLSVLKWTGPLESGEYSYRVRAVNNFGVVGKWSPLQPFEVPPDPAAEVAEAAKSESYQKNPNYVRAGYGRGNYNYANSVQNLGTGKGKGGEVQVLQVAGQFWPFHIMGLHASATFRDANVFGENINLFELDAAVKFSFFNSPGNRFFFYPFLGVNQQDIAEISKVFPTASQFTVAKMNALSVNFGVELGFFLTDNIVLGAVGKYQKVLQLKGAPNGGGENQGSSISDIFVYGEYRLARRWSLGLGANYLSQSYQYGSRGAAQSTIDLSSFSLLGYGKFHFGD